MPEKDRLTALPILTIPVGIAGNILFLRVPLPLLPTMEELLEELKLGRDHGSEKNNDAYNGLHDGAAAINEL